MIPINIDQHFSQLAEPALQKEIQQVGKYMEFQAGDVILDYGHYVKFVPMVIEGAIRVMREDEEGREIFLYYLNPGDTCAMSFTCCMMNKKSEIKTIAEEDTKIIGIPIRYIDLWISKYQSWKNFILLSYNDRMEELLKALDSIAFMRMDERLIKYLREKAKATGSDVIHITHQQIAYALNASREAVSRLLKKLENKGEIKLGRNKIKLLKLSPQIS